MSRGQIHITPVLPFPPHIFFSYTQSEEFSVLLSIFLLKAFSFYFWDYNLITFLHSLSSLPYSPLHSPLNHGVFFHYITYLYVYITCIYTYSPKYNLFGMYNATCFYVFRTALSLFKIRQFWYFVNFSLCPFPYLIIWSGEMFPSQGSEGATKAREDQKTGPLDPWNKTSSMWKLTPRYGLNQNIFS